MIATVPAGMLGRPGRWATKFLTARPFLIRPVPFAEFQVLD